MEVCRDFYRSHMRTNLRDGTDLVPGKMFARANVASRTGPLNVYPSRQIPTQMMRISLSYWNQRKTDPADRGGTDLVSGANP